MLGGMCVLTTRSGSKQELSLHCRREIFLLDACMHVSTCSQSRFDRDGNTIKSKIQITSDILVGLLPIQP